MYKHRVLYKLRNPRRREGNSLSYLVRVWLTDNSFTTIKGNLFPRWKLEVVLGNGAGCVWGRTLYLACNLFYPIATTYRRHFKYHWWEHLAFGGVGRGGRSLRRYQVGYTANSNLVPYVDGN